MLARSDTADPLGHWTAVAFAGSQAATPLFADLTRMGIDANGNFAVAWKSLDAVTGAGKGIAVQRFASSGVPLGTEFLNFGYVLGRDHRGPAFLVLV